MISSICVKKFFDLVKSFDFYGRLKLLNWHSAMDHFRGYEGSGTSTFCDVIQGTRHNVLSAHMQIVCINIHGVRVYCRKTKMVNSCVAANCTNKASLSNGISLHTIPYYNDERPEAKRRKIWVDFVKAKRVFEPSNASTLCSAHFRPEDYERRFSILPTQTKPNHLRLKRDDIGICVFPSIQAVPTTSPNEDLQTPRSRRMVSVVNRGLLWDEVLSCFGH